MKTADEIISYLADRIGHIYFHSKPLMFAANAVELDRILYLYHEIWAEIVGRNDLGLQLESSLGFAIPYLRQHPEATDEQVAKEVVRRWSFVSTNLELPIPNEALSQKFQQNYPLPSVPKMLLRAASKIQDDDLLQLQVPASMFLFLHQLGKQCDHSTKPLGRFLTSISSEQLADEITRDLLPAEFKYARNELERLQYAREVAIVNQDWEHAVALRDQAVLLKDRVRQACPDAIEIRPENILQAVARLGYDQPMTV